MLQRLWIRAAVYIGAALPGLALLVGPGCGSTTKPSDTNPTVGIRDPDLSEAERVNAAKRAWHQTADDPSDRAKLVAVLTDTAWDPRASTAVRACSIDLFIDDPDPETARVGRAMARQMLPREQSRAMVAHLCSRIAAGGWTECSPALVRSYSRPVPGVPDPERGERVALVALYPDRSPEQVVFEMFLSPPPPEPDIKVPDWTERLRAESWELLGRLDGEGTIRASLLTGSGGGSDLDPVVRAMRRCRTELGCVPITGDELKWLLTLADDSRPGNSAWWAQAAAAVKLVPEANRAGLHMCHVEPIRWAAENQPSWLAASREVLLGELSQCLNDRTHRRRTIDANQFRQPLPNRLGDWESHMRWGDVLAVLVVDKAIHAPTIGPSLFQQAELDQRDTSTEFGGFLESLPQPAGAFRARMFPPRPGQRSGDTRFVASDDLIASADHALAVYHFHVQRWHNEDYAGPSKDDLIFAARSGRTCVVFTSINQDTLNADYYQPDGVTLDLGDLTR